MKTQPIAGVAQGEALSAAICRKIVALSAQTPPGRRMM
jgi:hypothetical protein